MRSREWFWVLQRQQDIQTTQKKNSSRGGKLILATGAAALPQVHLPLWHLLSSGALKLHRSRQWGRKNFQNQGSASQGGKEVFADLNSFCKILNHESLTERFVKLSWNHCGFNGSCDLLVALVRPKGAISKEGSKQSQGAGATATQVNGGNLWGHLLGEKASCSASSFGSTCLEYQAGKGQKSHLGRILDHYRPPPAMGKIH